MHRVSGMFFCTLLLCQVSLAQQTAHVEGALLLGEKRNIHAGAGRVSGCNWVEVLGGEAMAGEERIRPAKWDAQSRCGYQVVGCVPSQDCWSFYSSCMLLAEMLWSTFAVTEATATTITTWAEPVCWDSQLFLPWAGCTCRKGTLGSCLKALQPAASGRYDMPKTGGLSGVYVGEPLLSRMFQVAPCTRIFPQGFQGFGILLGQWQWPHLTLML